MSVERCTECFREIDTDQDVDCYIADKVICERCRDAMQTDGRLIVVDEEYRLEER